MDLIEHEVRERAYFIWEGEGRVFGRAEAHWLQAEAELLSRAASLRIEAVAADATRVASPAEVLKPRASRAKAPAKVALTDVAAPAKTTAPKTIASKTAAPKKAAAPKTAAANAVTTNAVTTKAVTTKAVTTKAKPRTPRADATVGVSLH